MWPQGQWEAYKNGTQWRRQTNKRTWPLYDWIGPVGLTQWNYCSLSVDVTTFLFCFSSETIYLKEKLSSSWKRDNFIRKVWGKVAIISRPWRSQELPGAAVKTPPWLIKWVMICKTYFYCSMIEDKASDVSFDLINIKELQCCGFCSPAVHPAGLHCSTVALSPAPL